MKIVKEIYSWAGTFSVALIIALFVSMFVFQSYKVEGHSMDPTLDDQERIYVSKLSHSFSYLPQYGDIVVIDSRVDRDRGFLDNLREQPLIHFIMNGKSSEEHIYYVKRVVGKPGDVLAFHDHHVYRNGKQVEEPYIKETMTYVSDQTLTVPAGHVFVMGDNRNNSWDSRDIGFIPLDHVMGIKKLP